MISGSAQVGQSLTATAGGWSGSPTSYAYQWRRCDTIGNGCVSIAGATSNSYLLASGDGGYTLRIAVSATNADGTVLATSHPTAVVTAPASSSPSPSLPANTSLPVISGTAVAGQRLSASTGSWSGSPTRYSFQWRRCSSNGYACVSVAGAEGSSSSYLLGSADVGYTMRVNVFATNAAGTTWMNSNPSAVVQAAPATTAPVNTLLPTISGIARVGQSLTVGNGSWSGNPTRYTYQWRRCNFKGNACAYVPGATASSYLLSSGDVGYTIRVNVFATNAAGTTWMNSNPTAVVQ